MQCTDLSLHPHRRRTRMAPLCHVFACHGIAMKRRRWGVQAMDRGIRVLVALTFLTALLSGCATTGGVRSTPPRSTCALIGGVVGALAGYVVANNESESETDEEVTGGAI